MFSKQDVYASLSIGWQCCNRCHFTANYASGTEKTDEYNCVLRWYFTSRKVTIISHLCTYQFGLIHKSGQSVVICVKFLWKKKKSTVTLNLRLPSYDPFPLSDSDVAKYRVVLLSMGLFPLNKSYNDSNSDVTIAKYWMDSVPIC